MNDQPSRQVRGYGCLWIVDEGSAVIQPATVTHSTSTRSFGVNRDGIIVAWAWNGFTRSAGEGQVLARQRGRLSALCDSNSGPQDW